MEKCNIAVVGYGGMAAGWHVPHLLAMPDKFNLCGVYDILEERREAARKNNIYAYETFEELLADDRIEIAIIAIPNDQHKSVAIALMDRKINVICEKPVTMSSSDLEEMIASANKNSVLFTVHQNRRWDEDYLIIKKIYDENTLGKIFNIESRVQGSRGIPGDWRNTKVAGGGMVLDWGIHLYDQILMMTKGEKIVSVYSDLSFVTNEEVDDGFKTILHFESGLTVHVEVGTSNFIELPRWYVMGENGSAIINDWALNGKIVKVTDWEKREPVPVATAAGLTKTMAPRTDETIAEEPLPRVPSDINKYYINVVKAIRGQEPVNITHDQLRRSMKLMEAVFESAAKNEVIHTTI